MDHPLRIRDGIDLLMITGGPGVSKSTVAKLIFCAQTEEWRMLSLDDYFYLSDGRVAVAGDNWDRFAANAHLRASIIRYIADRHGKVIAEGIIQTDEEVAAYCGAIHADPTSTRVRLVELQCPTEIAVDRMMGRPMKEDAQQGSTPVDHARHHEWLKGRLRARGAIRVAAVKGSPAEIAARVVEKVNLA
jgi:hypothetical protein